MFTISYSRFSLFGYIRTVLYSFPSPTKKTDLTNAVCLIAPIASSITSRKLVELLGKKNADLILLPTTTF